MKLRLSTHVNGQLTQQGTTADMVFDVPTLIEYFSSFMTLNPSRTAIPPDFILEVLDAPTPRQGKPCQTGLQRSAARDTRAS